MSIGDGAGTSISFSEIQAFYGGTNPISISEYNRGGSFVPTSFAGASTATTGTSSQTVDDFAVTVADDSTSQTIGFSGSPATFTVDTGTGGGSTVTISLTNNNSGEGTASLTRGGNTLINTNGATVTTTVNNGDVLTLAGTGNANPVCSYPRITRVYDITFQNNSSTGDTYTLTSGSTGTETVYSPGESVKVRNDESTNSWVLAYDNVTGSGSGTAGDITVTVANSTGIAGSVTNSVSGQNTVCTLTAPSLDNISFISVGGLTSNDNNDSNCTASLFRNGTLVATRTEFDSLTASVSYTGAVSPGDVFQVTGGVNGRTLGIDYTTPSRSISFTNNGSSTMQLGSSSTGGAKSIAAGQTKTAQPGGSTFNQSWAVHFDTGSGNCNTNVPTSIGTGNSVGLDTFNAPGTPVG